MQPVSPEIFRQTLESMHIPNIAATIRQIAALAARLREPLGEDFIHLEMGNPGLPPSAVGIEAEREALLDGVAGTYPNIAGIPQLKEAGSDFLRAFFDIDIRRLHAGHFHSVSPHGTAHPRKGHHPFP